MLFVASKICPYTQWIQHYLSLFLTETFLTRESWITTQTRRYLSLLIFTRLQYPMGRHLIQLVYSDKVGTFYCLEKIKLHSHRDIYGINIILQCSLLLIYLYKFCKHNSKKTRMFVTGKNILPCLGWRLT